jgi:catechol 2,3-dioxygenase-like lactoylglutathione lyase family enzyme
VINGIHHTAISTPNLERMLAFYRDVLGFEVMMEMGGPAGTAPTMRFHCPPVDYGMLKTTYGRDPDGNVIEVQELIGENPIRLESLASE